MRLVTGLCLVGALIPACACAPHVEEVSPNGELALGVYSLDPFGSHRVRALFLEESGVGTFRTVQACPLPISGNAVAWVETIDGVEVTDASEEGAPLLESSLITALVFQPIECGETLALMRTRDREPTEIPIYKGVIQCTTMEEGATVVWSSSEPCTDG